jgi:hypothetical protein
MSSTGGSSKPRVVWSKRTKAYLKNQELTRRARGMPMNPALRASASSRAKTIMTATAPPRAGLRK